MKWQSGSKIPKILHLPLLVAARGVMCLVNYWIWCVCGVKLHKGGEGGGAHSLALFRSFALRSTDAMGKAHQIKLFTLR